jgi:hypothetical protein
MRSVDTVDEVVEYEGNRVPQTALGFDTCKTRSYVCLLKRKSLQLLHTLLALNMPQVHRLSSA